MERRDAKWLGRVAATLVLLLAALAVCATGASAKQRIFFDDFEASSWLRNRDIRANGTLAVGSARRVGEAGHEGLAIAPNGKHLYVVGRDAELFGLRVAGDGDPFPEPTQPKTIGGDPYGVVVSPNGRYVYAASRANDTLWGFRIRSNGGLRPVPGGATDAPEGPQGLAFAPNGKYLYATTEEGGIHAWRIRADGRPVELAASPFPGGENSFAISTTPNGRNLYIATNDAVEVARGYSIRGNGRLVELDGSPYPVGDGPFGSTISPNGRTLHVLNYFDGDGDTYRIGPGGELTSLPGFDVPGSPAAIATTADGAFSYVYSGSDTEVHIFEADANGTLAPIGASTSEVGSLGDFQSVAISPAQPPKAKLKVKGRGDPSKGERVRFTAAKSKDRDGIVAQYDWKFGDGTKRVDAGPRVKHRFARKGRYKVTVTVTDEDNCSVKYVSAGQTAYCNGSKRRARAAKRVRVVR